MEHAELILKVLRRSDDKITGTELARQLGISRQVVVQKVALLRAEGHPVLATPQGYCLDVPHRGQGKRTVVAVRHDPDRTGDELGLLIELGLSVINVIVDHPIYGEITGNLMLHNQQDVDRFIDRLERHRTSLLSTLTNGHHLHTLEYDKVADLTRAQTELARRGYLVTD